MNTQQTLDQLRHEYKSLLPLLDYRHSRTRTRTARRLVAILQEAAHLQWCIDNPLVAAQSLTPQYDDCFACNGQGCDLCEANAGEDAQSEGLYLFIDELIAVKRSR